MAEFIPLSTPEKNSDASWYTAIGAGLVSGVIKTVEGVVSLGAELIDLGADSNTSCGKSPLGLNGEPMYLLTHLSNALSLYASSLPRVARALPPLPTP